jgi:hypothetical protein
MYANARRTQRSRLSDCWRSWTRLLDLVVVRVAVELLDGVVDLAQGVPETDEGATMPAVVSVPR